MDDQAADGTLRVLDREGRRSVCGVADRARVADLAAALGVERRLVEDQLGRGAGLGAQLDLGTASSSWYSWRPHDGYDLARPSSCRSRGTSVSPARARMPSYSGGRLGLAGELRLATAARAVALIGEGDLEAGSVDRHAVFGGQLDRQVDGEAERVVEPEGHLASEHRCIGGQRLGASARRFARHPSAGCSASSSWMCPHRASGRTALLAPMTVADLVGALAEVGYTSPMVSMTTAGSSARNGSRPSQQAAVPDRATHDAPQDIAATLVGRQHAVGDEEGDGTRVVGDDLVAEALGLERLRVVAQELRIRVDRREEVRVVVGGDALDHRRQALQAQARVDAREGQRHAPLRPLVELHEDQVPELQPAWALLANGRARNADPRRDCAPRS